MEGVLTRGKKWDRIFPPFWDCPIDMQRREDMRRKKTELIIIALNLEKNVIEQQEKNKLEQEEKARIKIDVNGNRIISVKTEEIKLSASSIVQELRKISENIDFKIVKCT